MPIVADAAVAIRGDLSKFSSDLDKAETQTKSLGGKLKNALSPGNLAAGLAGGFAVSQIGSFLGDAIQAAGEFADTVSATGIIFTDEFTPALEEWAEEAHSAFGASKQDALAAANQIAVFGKSAGLAGQELVGFSTEMVQLGGDLASMFGGSTQDAITAVGAALRGESEPIRRYGVLLDDATLRQKAFEMGIIDSITKALTPQQRVLAAQAAIMEQTSDAQGNFVLTSDDLLNVQRDLAAEMENLTVEIGQKLLPVMVSLARFARDSVIPALRDVGDAIDTIIRGAVRLKEASGKGADWLSGLFGLDSDTRSRLDQQVQEATHQLFGTATKQIEVDAENLSRQAANVLTAGADGVAAGAKVGITDPMHKAMREAREKAVAEAKALPGDLARALVSGIPNIKDAWDAAVKLSQESLSDLNKIAYYEGVLSSKELAAGVNDERADVRASWLAIREDATYNLNLLKSGAADAGVDTGTTFAEQLRLQDVKIRDATSAALLQAKGIFQDTTYASDGGTAIANAWTNALDAALSSGYSVTATYVKKYQRLLGSSLPTEGPLQHPERGGKSIAEAWVQKGLVAGLRAGLGDVTAALPTLSANGGLPSMTSLALGATSAVASGATIGDTNININAPTVPMTARDIGRELRRTGVFGGTP